MQEAWPQGECLMGTRTTRSTDHSAQTVWRSPLAICAHMDMHVHIRYRSQMRDVRAAERWKVRVPSQPASFQYLYQLKKLGL